MQKKKEYELREAIIIDISVLALSLDDYRCALEWRGSRELWPLLLRFLLRYFVVVASRRRIRDIYIMFIYLFLRFLNIFIFRRLLRLAWNWKRFWELGNSTGLGATI